ncbi:MAG: hypothetical protein ACRDDY_13155 [Clostridium sp.]|uniref:hypothetical protein n=1 Tax=Clostridium sp. TaxID=1506 RepID=UPI003EE60A52
MNNKKNKTSMTPETRKNMPPRGRGKFSVLLEVIKENSMIDLTPDATQEEAQKKFLLHVAKRAFNPEDQVSGNLLNSLINRCFPAIKPVLPECDIGFEDGDSLDVMAAKILSAAGSGKITPDTGAVLMTLLKDKATINQKGEIIDRLEKLEQVLSERSNPKEA